jgi:hypothetical protein
MKSFRRYVSVPLFLSLLLHICVIYYVLDSLRDANPRLEGRDTTKTLLPDYERPLTPAMPLTVLSEAEYRAIVESRRLQNLGDERIKDRAKYLGSQTQRVERETRAQGFGSQEGESKTASKTQKKLLSEDMASLWKLPIEGELREESQSDSGQKLRKGSMDLLDRDVAIGADTVLNTDQYIYASFFNRLKQEIGPRWEPKVQQFFRSTLFLSEGVYSTRYAFYLDDEGNLLSIEPLEASGSGTLDSIAAQAIREVGRFPNPPKALKENGRYKIIFGFIAEYSKNRFLPKYVPDPRFGN